MRAPRAHKDQPVHRARPVKMVLTDWLARQDPLARKDQRVPQVLKAPPDRTERTALPACLASTASPVWMVCPVWTVFQGWTALMQSRLAAL